MKRSIDLVAMLSAAAVLTVTAILSGCSVGPNYNRPTDHPPENFAEASTRPATQPAADLKVWWTAFGDPQLDSLIDRAVQSNYNLQAAAARIRAARAQRGFVSAGYFPSVDATGSYTRSRRSSNLSNNNNNNNNGGSFSSGGRTSDLYEAGFDASWEIDVFGGVRRGVESADADIQAAVEDRNDVLIILLSDVARNYIELRGAQRELTITQKNLKSQQDTRDLITERFRAGISSDLDVSRAEAQVQSTAASVPTQEQRVRLAIHQLGTLLGQNPEALIDELLPPKELSRVLPEVPLGLPSELLRRRPDVRRSERQLAAATANIGVATADWFPHFSLTGSFGLQSAKFKDLADSDSKFWNIGPAVRWNIFDAGKIRSNVAVFEARQMQALAGYRQAVIGSLQEVEDALSSYDREQVRRGALQKAVDANRRAVDLSLQLYQRGLVDFLSVLDSQRTLFIAEDALVQSDTTVSTNLIALYKALGGGWEPVEQGAK